MKRTLFFMVFVLALITMLAQEYHPEGTKRTEQETKTHRMLVNGRRWNYREFYLSENGTPPNDSTYPMDTVYRNITIDGPYEFDGKPCYKSANVTVEKAKTFFYEEGSKVYVYGMNYLTNEYGWREEFNFDLEVGDKNCYDFPVLSVDTICVNGEYYRRLKFSYNTWVEGIGSLIGGIYDIKDMIVPGTFLGSEVVSVYDGDKCVFTTDDFNIQPYTYRPFIEDGKVWVVKGFPDDYYYEEDDTWREYYFFAGDTIVGGHTCKQMKYILNATEENWVNGVFTPASSSQCYIGAFYEEDKKVYFALASREQFDLWYDFGLSTNDSIAPFNEPGFQVFVKKISGGMPGFKGPYYELWYDNQVMGHWLEGVGCTSRPFQIYPWLWAGGGSGLLYCSVGDEVIYYNSKVVDPYDMEAPKHRFDFTHTTKTQPKTPRRSEEEEEQSLYGEYNKQLLAINLDPIDEAYLVRITDETGNVVYEKAINAGNIVALNIDISAYAAGLYTVTVENSQESFTGEFEVQTTGIRDALRLKNNEEIKNKIYNLQGQRLNTLQKGLNIVNGKKIYVK